ncbi:MAG: hypothetical protein V7L11_01265 [Nostoc sp.]|uniref:hypothetical protein n=1 Tax=Nostoc sp. TaxID=1180 RepID=UPI002FFC34F2
MAYQESKSQLCDRIFIYSKAIALRPKIAIAFCSTPLMRSLMMIVQKEDAIYRVSI